MEPPSNSSAAEGGGPVVALDGPIPESASFNEIIVPTVDTVRYTWLLTLLATHGGHVLFAGPTGTGKTVYVKAGIEALDKSHYTNQQTAFSAQTSANMIQVWYRRGAVCVGGREEWTSNAPETVLGEGREGGSKEERLDT